MQCNLNLLGSTVVRGEDWTSRCCKNAPIPLVMSHSDRSARANCSSRKHLALKPIRRPMVRCDKSASVNTSGYVQPVRLSSPSISTPCKGYSPCRYAGTLARSPESRNPPVQAAIEKTMTSLFPKRIPCSICGVETLRHEGWYLVADDRWRDRLRIFTWDSALASQHGFKGACSRSHLKMLIACWLDQANLRLASENAAVSRPTPPGPRSLSAMEMSAHLVGELSIFRDAFSQGWTGSAETLDSIVDALIPVDNRAPVRAKRFQPISKFSYSSALGLSLQ